MGKRLDELDFSDEPLLPRRMETPDLRSQPWYQFVQEIDELLDNQQYDWAWDTLEGIKASVQRYQSVTEGQDRAIRNIKRAGREKASGRRYNRRYEGWQR